jgi:RNA polymerase sigma factor (sigma-70 family)
MIRQGQPDGLFGLYQAAYRPLLRYGLKVCRDPELTRDAINQIFLELWEKQAQLPVVAQVLPYLFTYLRRRLWAKQKLASALPPPDVETSEPSYEDLLIAQQQADQAKLRLQQALAQLSPRQVELLELKFFEELTYEQIAERTGMTTKTAYNTVYDALKRLRGHLLLGLGPAVAGWLTLLMAALISAGFWSLK